MDARTDNKGSRKRKFQDDDTGNAAVSTLSKPPRFPEKIMVMIFKEYLSKPAIHFVEPTVVSESETDGMVIKPWTNGILKSGYLSTQTLNATSKLARKTVRGATFEPTIIRFTDGSVQVDAATDLICFVPGRWGPAMQLSYQQDDSSPREALWFPKRRELDTDANLSNIRRAGMLVTKDAWYQMLRCWFTPKIGSYPEGMRVMTGLRQIRNLSFLVGELLPLEAFYFVLPDIGEDDWLEYYQKFPIAFHDHTGSYVEAREVPLHFSCMDGLMDLSIWPYQYDPLPNIMADADFPRRFDSQVTNQERVKMLLGALDGVRREIRDDGQFEVGGLKFGVLARKPDLTGDKTSLVGPREPPPTRQDDRRALSGLGSDDSEELWVRKALAELMGTSDDAIEDGRKEVLDDEDSDGEDFDGEVFDDEDSD